MAKYIVRAEVEAESPEAAQAILNQRQGYGLLSFTQPLGRVKLLDHGYLNYVEHWGSDAAIIEAARMSTQKGFLGWEPRACDCTMDVPDGMVADPECLFCEGTGQLRGDKHLLRHLYQNWHETPFEMAGIVIEVQAPIAVFREWHRHRTQSYNEMSARYAPLPDLNYIPTVQRLMMGGGTNKQAGAIKGSEQLTAETAREFQRSLQYAYQHDEACYQSALQKGVPKELARLMLPVGRYSRMRALANLRNWMAFLTLRSSTKAQWEIRQYALEVARLIEQLYPRTYELYLQGRG